ncbi:beta-glucosidase [Shewanella sp. KX20019]|uniref:DUF6701 domain-containing protein n=1 Tax=Shewanella sp. KX20019 TaxID=2803864 RepID=UPI0019285E3F|nr:DUF6701 domain-containing protein [Shewanella sp. KX20019]QQX79713.1 beta-glucosidase [Shewanella sp. KX20019]
MAGDWRNTFKAGVNSYQSSSLIRFYNGSRLDNAPTNGMLPSEQVEDFGKSCYPGRNAKGCKAGNYLAELPSDRLSFEQCLSSSTKDLGPSDAVDNIITVADGEYDSVFSRGNTVRFTSQDGSGIYRLKSLYMESGTLQLEPGQYWIENLTILKNVTVEWPTDGTVAFFVRNRFVQYNRLYPYRSELFVLYGYGDIDLATNSFMRGHVVSEHNLVMSYGADVEGALTANYISLANRARVVFDARSNLIDLVPNCDLAPVNPPKPPVPAQCLTGQDNVEGLTYRTYDASDWDDEGDSPEDHDEFEDLIDTVKKTTLQIGESIETNLDQKGSRINPHSNNSADQDLYLGIFEGFIDAPETGEYTFAVDGDDAIELLIDGEVVTGFYDAHATCNCTSYQGKVSLEQGTHSIELRFHEAFGHESFRLYWQKPSQSSLSIVPASSLLTCPAPQFEFGRVTLDSSGNAAISFTNSYAAAPIVMVMPTIDGAIAKSDNPATVRVVSRGPDDASIQQVNASGSSTLSQKMTSVDYFVMEPGYKFLARGKALQAGTILTSKFQGKNASGSNPGYSNVTFEHAFGATDEMPAPAMLGQTFTQANNSFITTVINNVASDEFDIAIEASELYSTINDDELIGYVAGLGHGSMNIAGESIRYEFYNAQNSIGGVLRLQEQCDYPNQYGYQQDYSTQPITIANKNSRAGPDGGWVRRCTMESFSKKVSFVIDEDYQDPERRHTVEDIGYFAFEYTVEPPATNHYRISFSSNGLTCAAKEITIRACSDVDCHSELADPATVELTKDDQSYKTETFVGSTVTDLWHTEVGNVKVGLGGTVPSGTYTCYIDNVLVANENCTLTFSDSGLYFDVDNSTACKNSNSFELFAVKKDTQTQQCVPLFSGETRTVDMDFNHVSPNSSDVIERAKLTVNSENTPSSSVTLESGTPQGLQVKFDSDGKASLNVNYPEAGKIALIASASIEAPDGSGDIELLQHTNEFVSAPDGFHFFNDSGSDGCITADCALFAKAGDDFKLNVKAVCGVDDSTPYKSRPALKNFQLSDIKIKPILKAPLAINSNDTMDGGLGTIGQSQISFTKANGAPLKLTNQTYSEVGAIGFSLDGDIDYMGVAISESQSSSEIFGRFSPFFLAIEENTPALSATCASFTYMDQPFGFAVGSEPTIKVVGRNKANGVTSNYQLDDWWRYDGRVWNDRSYSDTSGAISEDGAGLQVLDESPKSGTVKYYSTDSSNTIRRAYLSDAQVHYARTASLAKPFNAQFDLELSVADVTDEDGICYRESADKACIGFTFNDIAENDNFEMRYGRLVMHNAFGPSSEELRLALGTEYVNSSAQWVNNAQDSCSVFDTTTATVVDDTGLVLRPDAGLGAVEGFTNTGGSGKAGAIGLGNSFIYFPAPNAEGEVGLQLHVDKWLQWYWNFDSAALEDPRATAFFGTYRGHDRIIYWREVN